MPFHFPVCELHEARRGKNERVCFRHTALATVYTQLQQKASMKQEKKLNDQFDASHHVSSPYLCIIIIIDLFFTCNSFLRKDVQYIHFAMLESATYLIFGDKKTQNKTSLKQVANERNGQDGNRTRVFTAQLNVRWQKYKLRNQTELQPVTLEEEVKQEILRTDTVHLFSITLCPGI